MGHWQWEVGIDDRWLLGESFTNLMVAPIYMNMDYNLKRLKVCTLITNLRE